MYNRSQSGYALAEVLLATVVISISVVELSRALSNINRVAVVASAVTKAGNQADVLMKKIMSKRFDENIYNSYSLDLDGDTGHIVASGYKGISGRNARTVELWFKVDNDDLGLSPYGLVYWGEEDYCKRWRIDLIRSGGSLYPSVDLNNAAVRPSSTNIITDESWHHLAVTAESGGRSSEVRIYFDGELLNTATSDPNWCPDFNTGSLSNVTIGAGYGSWSGGSYRYFGGEIKEVRIWNYVRSDDEIRESYEGSKISNPGSNPGLVLYYMMDDSKGGLVYDKSSSCAHGRLMGGSAWTVGGWTQDLGAESEIGPDEYDDVDDFHMYDIVDTAFTGLGSRVMVKYLSLDPGTWTLSNAMEGSLTNYKQVTVKVGLPGTADSVRLDAIIAADVSQYGDITIFPFGDSQDGMFDIIPLGE